MPSITCRRQRTLINTYICAYMLRYIHTSICSCGSPTLRHIKDTQTRITVTFDTTTLHTCCCHCFGDLSVCCCRCCCTLHDWHLVAALMMMILVKMNRIVRGTATDGFTYIHVYNCLYGFAAFRFSGRATDIYFGGYMNAYVSW